MVVEDEVGPPASRRRGQKGDGGGAGAAAAAQRGQRPGRRRRAHRRPAQAQAQAQGRPAGGAVGRPPPLDVRVGGASGTAWTVTWWARRGMAPGAAAPEAASAAGHVAARGRRPGARWAGRPPRDGDDDDDGDDGLPSPTTLWSLHLVIFCFFTLKRRSSGAHPTCSRCPRPYKTGVSGPARSSVRSLPALGSARSSSATSPRANGGPDGSWSCRVPYAFSTFDPALDLYGLWLLPLRKHARCVPPLPPQPGQNHAPDDFLFISPVETPDAQASTG